MIVDDFPKTQDLVLIGGGHSHALVLRSWGMKPLPGARVTLINPGPTAPYSGMLPGFVAGHYDRDTLDIDLVKLARFSGARIILGAAEALDLKQREVHVAGRPPIRFDVCSVDVGITSEMPDLPGFAMHGVPAKPLGIFAQQWQGYLHQSGAAHVAVIGGGVAGAELAMAMAHALFQNDRGGTVHLIEARTALTAVSHRARRKLLAEISAAGIILLENAQIAEVAADHVALTDGRIIPSRFTVGAAGARAYDWISKTGLDLTDGFISVGPTLQSSDAGVFAVGDCAHMVQSPRPKAGVFAVRQAPVLFDNLRSAMTGSRLRRFRPQSDYLKLVSLGRKAALAERHGIPLSGAVMWAWKDRIDRTFINRLRDLPVAPARPLPRERTNGLIEALGGKPLCGGCGAKVGRASLRNALAHLPAFDRADVVSLAGDDAAVLKIADRFQVLTSDHLRSVTDDPVMMARIAATHALGDVWAMGAAPQAATATIILPRLSVELQRRTIAEIMTAAAQVMRAAGAEIVGGHTTIGAELTIGFSITGLCEAAPITLAGGCAGDALILTKPLGSGVLMAAEMAGSAKGEWIAAAYDLMVQDQAVAARILSGAHAMTDVTGFGLAGHLLGLCEASQSGALIDVADIPLMPGALEAHQSGVRSSIYGDNRSLVPSLSEAGKAGLLFDPQTSGGLLAAVDAMDAEDIIARLRDAGYAAARIGTLTAGPAQISLAST